MQEQQKELNQKVNDNGRLIEASRRVERQSIEREDTLYKPFVKLVGTITYRCKKCNSAFHLYEDIIMWTCPICGEVNKVKRSK